MGKIPGDVLLFSQLLGFLPVRARAEGLRYSTTLYIYGLLGVSLQTLSTCTALYLDTWGTNHIRMAGGTSSVLSVFLDVLPLNFMSTFIFLTTTKRYREFITLCGVLDEFDVLTVAKVGRPHSAFRVIVFVLFTIVISVATEASNIRELQGEILYSPLITAYFVQAGMFVHFTFIAQSIADRFSLVRDRLNILLEETNDDRKEEVKSGRWSLTQLRTLVDSYSLLCDAVDLVNSFYGLQLLFTVLSSFVHIMNTLYSLSISAWPSVKPHLVRDLLVHGAWSVFHVSHLVLLTWPCSTLTQAPTQIAAVVCRLINMDLDLEVRLLLERFLLQLMHYRPSISAFGFFHLDSSLLTSIAGSVTTFSIIMIQFYTSNK